MSIYQDVRDSIIQAATQIGVDGKEFKSVEIREWIEANQAGAWPRFEPSFQSHFSHAVNGDAECSIERVPGKFLYRLSQTAAGLSLETSFDAVLPSDACGTSSEYESKKVQRENGLYKVLRDWLESRGYQAKVTATTKSGGTWGNPDITGLRLDELPTGPAGVESATIEAKLSSNSWKYYIFESVAHKRFANRAWFAFAIGTDSPDLTEIKDAEQLAEYAEKYRIGILVVFVSKDHYEQLTQGDAASLELGPDDVRIEVLWPAIYEAVHVPSLNDFMVNVLRIKSHNDFGKFGRIP